VAGGIVAFGLTLGANLLVLAIGINQLCRVGPALFLLSSLVAFFAFLLVAAAAGLATTRAGGVILQAALSGLLVGALGACAVLATLAAAPAIHARLLEASAQCPAPNPFHGGAYSFQVGATPPPGLIPSPSPGGFSGSPGLSARSSGGSVAISVSGAMAKALEVASTVITILAGMGLAAGAAALCGGIGISLRSR
jgi:hypothetical protein